MPPGAWGASLGAWDSSHVSPVSTHSLVTAYTPQHLFLHVFRTQQSYVIACHVCVLYCPDVMYVQGYVYLSRVVVPDRTMPARTAGGLHHPVPSLMRPRPQFLPAVQHGYPTISGIRQIQKGSEPFKFVLDFWIVGCVASAGNTVYWHCSFADMQRQTGRGVRFWLSGSGGHGDLEKLHSNAKTYLDIICSTSRVSTSITADAILKHLLSGNTTGLITESDYSALYDATDDLDVRFAKHDRQWESFVKTQRDDLLHRPKRTKRV